MNRWKVLVALIAVFLLSMSVQAASSKDVIWPADAIKWEAGPLPGVHVAKLWGDWMKGGPYGVLVKFDAGVMNPLHKHTRTLKIVVISGTFVHQPKGGTETKLGPGSYLLQAGGTWHVSGCAAGADCEFFMTSSDKFDLIPAKK
jgi:anti-sigma factor ChrR (cupin superfamily)